MPSTTIVNSPLTPTTVSSKPSWLCGIGLRAPASKRQAMNYLLGQLEDLG